MSEADGEGSPRTLLRVGQQTVFEGGTGIQFSGDHVVVHVSQQHLPSSAVAPKDLHQLLHQRGWTLLWHVARESSWRTRMVNADLPFFVRGDRPSPADMECGDVYPRTVGVRAAAFLEEARAASIVLIRGEHGSGKSALALQIAWTWLQRDRHKHKVLGALPHAKGLLEVARTLPEDRLLFLIEDAHLCADLLDELHRELESYDGRLQILIVDPVEDPRRPYFSWVLERLRAANRLLELDTTALYGELSSSGLSDHLNHILRRRALPHRTSPRAVEALLADCAARRFDAIFKTLGQAIVAPQGQPAAARPAWLNAKVEAWAAISFSCDLPLPLGIARRATPDVPDELGSGAWGQMQWDESGVSFGHSEQAKALRITDRDSSLLELLEAALGADAGEFLLRLGRSLRDPNDGAVVRKIALQRLKALRDDLPLRAAEAAMLVLLAEDADCAERVYERLPRLPLPLTSDGLIFYALAVLPGLRHTSQRLREALLEHVLHVARRKDSDLQVREVVTWSIALAHSDACAQLERWQQRSQRDGAAREDAWAERLLDALFTMVSDSDCSDRQRDALAKGLAAAARRARAKQAHRLLRALHSAYVHATSEPSEVSDSDDGEVDFFDSPDERTKADRHFLTLREMVAKPSATRWQRDAYAEALYDKYQQVGGDDDDGATLLQELRTMAERPDASEVQRTFVARAIAAGTGMTVRDSGRDEQIEIRVDELRALATRAEGAEGTKAVLAKMLTLSLFSLGATDRPTSRSRLEELRELGMASDASDESRTSLATAIENAYRCGVLSFDERQWLEDLRIIARRGGAEPEAEDAMFESPLQERQRAWTSSLAEVAAQARAAHDQATAQALSAELRSLTLPTEVGVTGAPEAFAMLLRRGLDHFVRDGDDTSAARELQELRALAARHPLIGVEVELTTALISALSHALRQDAKDDVQRLEVEFRHRAAVHAEVIQSHFYGPLLDAYRQNLACGADKAEPLFQALSWLLERSGQLQASSEGGWSYAEDVWREVLALRSSV